MSRDLSARLNRLEGRLAAPSPDMVEQVAARLDRFAAVDPERANDLLISFGLRPCYLLHPDPFTSVPSTPEEIQ